MKYEWSDFDRFAEILDKYLPPVGEGHTMATQISTAVSKLVYRWFNDGDVYDNTHRLKGWCNDLSSYANWLFHNTDEGGVLVGISWCETPDDYTEVLYDLCEAVCDERFLQEADKISAISSVYTATGPFKFIDLEEEYADWEADYAEWEARCEDEDWEDEDDE